MPLLESDYKAPIWAVGGDLQTIIPAKISPGPAVEFEAELVRLPDGDEMLFHWKHPAVGHEEAPLLVIFHGLEGSSASHYVRALVSKAVLQGYRCVVAHFRTCGGIQGCLPRAYFAGDTADNFWVLQFIHRRYPKARLYAVGYSLGGNQLCKCLGDMGSEAHFVSAAVSVGAPLDLYEGSLILKKYSKRPYAAMFLSTLKDKVRNQVKRFGAFVDMRAIQAAKTLYEFDHFYTAPVHGFKDGEDYWKRASAKPVLVDVTVPLLLLNARNDPFFAAEFLPTDRELSSSVWADFPSQGGHVGFPQGRFPGNIDFIPERVLRFLNSQT